MLLNQRRPLDIRWSVSPAKWEDEVQASPPQVNSGETTRVAKGCSKWEHEEMALHTYPRSHFEVSSRQNVNGFLRANDSTCPWDPRLWHSYPSLAWLSGEERGNKQGRVLGRTKNKARGFLKENQTLYIPKKKKKRINAFPVWALLIAHRIVTRLLLWFQYWGLAGGWSVNFLLFETVFKDWNPSVPHISTYLSKPIPSPIEV